MNGNDTIESLTAAYLEGRLSPEEAERLLETIERDEQARRTLFEMKNLYDMGRINPLDQRQIEAGWERLVRQTSIRSGENRTAGRTSDRTPLRRMARTALRYAAVALIALSARLRYGACYVVLHRAAGQQRSGRRAKNHSEVVLSDGTRVTLNASSRLRYPTSFDGSAREVWLDGEAYCRRVARPAQTVRRAHRAPENPRTGNLVQRDGLRRRYVQYRHAVERGGAARRARNGGLAAGVGADETFPSNAASTRAPES